MTDVIALKRQSLLRSTTLVSLMTFFSRMTGFVRDMLIAILFGASAGMDAFLVAFRIPNFMRRLFAEGAFSQAFVPVLAEYQQTQPASEVRLFIARVAGQLSLVLTAVTVVGIIATPIIVWIVAPGFGEHTLRNQLAVDMLRITFPYLMLVSLTAMAGAVLNTYGYFGVPAITPIVLNIVMILAALYLRPYLTYPITSLAWGVLIAGILQLLIQLPFLKHRQLLVRPRRMQRDPGVKRVMKLMIPALFGVSIAQLNLMVDSIFASFLAVGSVSWLYYTDRLTDFPLGVFGVAISTVILPHLSRRHVDVSREQFSRALTWGIQLLLLIGFPAAVGLSIFSMPLIVTCFAYGHFSTVDVIQTQKSLIALATGLPAFMLVKVLASGFYATQDIQTPVKIGALSMVINSLLCALFILPLKHAGLALASSLASYVNCILLLRGLLVRKTYTPGKGWSVFFAQLLFANSLLALYLYYGVGELNEWITRSFSTRFFILLVHVSLSIIIYCVGLMAVGIRIKQFRGVMKETE